MSKKHGRLPDDLIDVAARLSAERPTLSAERLSMTRKRVLRRVRGVPSRGAPAKRPWRPRLVLTAMLVLGIMLSSTGVGLAISGLAGNGSAGVIQYEQPSGGTAPEHAGGGGGGGGGGQQPTAGQEEVAGQRQVTTGESGLPFTGLAAIPLILVGGTLLITGIGLRRRTT
jgi:hypothetical protein